MANVNNRAKCNNAKKHESKRDQKPLKQGKVQSGKGSLTINSPRNKAN